MRTRRFYAALAEDIAAADLTPVSSGARLSSSRLWIRQMKGGSSKTGAASLNDLDSPRKARARSREVASDKLQCSSPL